MSVLFSGCVKKVVEWKVEKFLIFIVIIFCVNISLIIVI